MNIKERIEQLRKLISYHSKRYYENDAPEISDFEYDKLFEELKTLELENPQYFSENSPTQRVGDTVFAIGAPLDDEYSWTVTRGILSGKDNYSSLYINTMMIFPHEHIIHPLLTTHNHFIPQLYSLFRVL